MTGARYSIQSDVWSFGLSLVELVIGRYPIPAPSCREYAKIFGIRAEEVQLDQNGVEDNTTAEDVTPKTMAIFELLDYIVNRVSGVRADTSWFPLVSISFQPPPVLPRKIFSDQFVNFVNRCLKKNVTERANLMALASDPFYKHHAAMEDGTEFAKWVQSVIGM